MTPQEPGGVRRRLTHMYSQSLRNNPLRTRADLQRAALELWRPLRPHLERDGAAIRLGMNESVFGAPSTMVECYARPLWGIAALAAGGGEFDDGELCRRALSEGVDPASPRYWGRIGRNDQRAVEMGSLAAALWIAPGLLWEPLERPVRRAVAAWLRQINDRPIWKNNWLFFRVLVNGALKSLGEAADERRLIEDLDTLSSFHLGGGWYSDGSTPQLDYYLPMAMQFYALVYAKCAGSGAPRAAEFLSRAREFAPDFASWFAADGAALPLGRSLTYRFAQGAFWGALAFAGVEALPWGVIKGLHLRHLRWWLQKPIFSESGLLTVGYTYPNALVAEGYIGPGSPYWALKAFLPLALPAEHPYWRAEEVESEGTGEVCSRHRAGLVVCRDDARRHVFALANNPVHPAGHRHAAQKYGKFSYSTVFGFHVPTGTATPREAAGDSMLLLSVDGRDWRGREGFVTGVENSNTLHSRWSPWPEVEVDTWLAPALPGHVRIHRVQTERPLKTFEGGFPLPRGTGIKLRSAAGGAALVASAEAFSGVWDLVEERKAQLIAPEPNTNLLHPLTLLPALAAELPPGEHWLFTAVAGLPGAGQSDVGERWRAGLEARTGDRRGIWREGKALIETCVDDEKPRKLAALTWARSGAWRRLLGGVKA